MVGINIACASVLSARSGEEQRLGNPAILHGQQPASYPQQEKPQEAKGEKERQKIKGASNKKALT